MNKPVILCIDDEPTVLESLKIELKRTVGDLCVIETAEGGAEAIELFEELQQEGCAVALVVADYIMPGLKGDEVLHYIHQRSPHTLNIILSGQADLDGVSTAIRSAGLYRYISKPWQPDDLGLTVNKAIQSYLRDRQLEVQTQELQQAHQTLEQLYQQLQQLNTNLEEQVQERTQQLQQRIQQVEELSHLKEYFLYAVSHDLRTPLMGMLLVLNNLQSSRNDPIALPRATLDRMVQSCERQVQLLSSLLETHSGDIQGITLEPESLNLGQLVEAIVQNLTPLIQQEQATLINQVALDLPPIHADPLQLQRVFENLITNALKHNPPGIQITLNAEVILTPSPSFGEAHEPPTPSPPTPTTIRCTIRDTGLGMGETECNSLFSRYARGSQRRRSIGVGLGLYLCQQIINAHHGQIGVISAPKQGSEFWFTVPIEGDWE